MQNPESERRRLDWRMFPEPIQFIYVLMFSICIVPKDKIYIDKVCQLDMKADLMQRNLTTDVCTVMSRNETFKDIEEETQRRVSELKLYEGLIMNLPSIGFSLYAGVLADSKGRTFIMAFAFIGNVVSSIWLMISVIWWDAFSAAYLLFSGVAGLTGGYMCLNIGLYSYISDTSSAENRTTRMSILTGIFSLGYVLGVQLGGRLDNYILVFLLSAVLGLLGTLYSLVILKETLPRSSSAPSRPIWRESLAAFQCVLRPRPSGARFALLVGIFQFEAFMLCMNTTEYDYLMTRLKFSWDKGDFSNFLTVQRTCRLIGLLVLLPIISRVLKIRDRSVIRLGCLVSLCSYLLLMVSSPTWGGDWPVYLAAALQLNSVTTVSIRSTLSKLVSQAETAKVFAVVGIFQAVTALVSHSLFGVIYNQTLDIYPTLYLVPILVFLAASVLLSFLTPSSTVLSVLAPSSAAHEDKLVS